jgi:hypothetical protein
MAVGPFREIPGVDELITVGIAAGITSTFMRATGRLQLGDFGSPKDGTFGPDAADRRGCELGGEGSMPRMGVLRISGFPKLCSAPLLSRCWCLPVSSARCWRLTSGSQEQSKGTKIASDS